MKLTIKQKQAIYEHLLTLDCPDLLAALIAERSEADITKEGTLAMCIRQFAAWCLTAENNDFWYNIFEEVVEMEEDFESPTGWDFAPIGDETAKIEILVDVPVPYSVGDVVMHKGEPLICTSIGAKLLKPSFIDKVKLWFGKLFYKV